jgi:hypothetical protein
MVLLYVSEGLGYCLDIFILLIVKLFFILVIFMIRYGLMGMVVHHDRCRMRVATRFGTATMSQMVSIMEEEDPDTVNHETQY